MDSKEYELQQCPECWAIYETDNSGIFACGGHDTPHAVVVLWPKQWVSKARETVKVHRDPDATSKFQHVAHVVTSMHERHDPALTAFIAARGLGVSPQELEAMGLPPF